MENEDVIGAAPIGEAPTTSERSTIWLPTKVSLIYIYNIYTNLTVFSTSREICSFFWHLIAFYLWTWTNQFTDTPQRSSRYWHWAQCQWSDPEEYKKVDLMNTLGTTYNRSELQQTMETTTRHCQAKLNWPNQSPQYINGRQDPMIRPEKFEISKLKSIHIKSVYKIQNSSYFIFFIYLFFHPGLVVVCRCAYFVPYCLELVYWGRSATTMLCIRWQDF